MGTWAHPIDAQRTGRWQEHNCRGEHPNAHFIAIMSTICAWRGTRLTVATSPCDAHLRLQDTSPRELLVAAGLQRDPLAAGAARADAFFSHHARTAMCLMVQIAKPSVTCTVGQRFRGAFGQ
jgi:hypothetical protein